MSEYQCYQWKKIEGGLSPSQRKKVSELSSHISVFSGFAQVEYHWGDFKHDPLEVLKNYFDLFVYEANWGTQRVALRFDVGAVDIDDLAQFRSEEAITVEEKGGHILVEAWFDENWVDSCVHFGGYDEYGDSGYLADTVDAIYREILEGDFRGLFILWLKSCDLSEKLHSNSITMPAGMAKLSDEHRALADFVGVSQKILDQAAKQSTSLPKKKNSKEENLTPFLDQISVERKNSYLSSLLEGDAFNVQMALKNELRRLMGQPHKTPNQKKGKIIEYRILVKEAHKEAVAEACRIQEEKEARRRAYLAELGKRENEIWDRVHQLVSEKKPKAYDEAVLLLRGLEDLWTEQKDRDYFLSGVKTLTGEFPRLTGFRRRLEEAGWIVPGKRPANAIFKNLIERWNESHPLQREIDFMNL